MATLKLTLRKRANKDGTYPIVLRVIIDRKVSYIATGMAIHAEGWDEKAERIRKNAVANVTRANALLAKKKTLAQERIWQLESTGQSVTLEDIRLAVTGDSKEKQKAIETDFFIHADRFVQNLQLAGKYNRHKAERSRIALFKEYLGSDAALSFSHITVGLLKGFTAYLKAVRRVKERTVSNYMILIRTIYNQAIKDGLVSRDDYPFGKGKITVKLPEAVKVGLTAAEIHRLEHVALTGYQDHARNVWLLSFYFAGMRLSDVMRLKWSDVKDGRLYYAMSKNSKVGSLKVPAKAHALLEQYRLKNNNSLYVLPELQGTEHKPDPYTIQKIIAFNGKRLEKALKAIAASLNIDKKLSMHVARHSFAQIAADKIPVQILQKLYRHSHISTTVGYQSHFTTQHTDDALDQVIGDG